MRITKSKKRAEQITTYANDGTLGLLRTNNRMARRMAKKAESNSMKNKVKQGYCHNCGTWSDELTMIYWAVIGEKEYYCESCARGEGHG